MGRRGTLAAGSGPQVDSHPAPIHPAILRRVLCPDGCEDSDVTPARKLDGLREIIRSLERVVIAYSGGVDSSFLAAVAHDVLGRSAAMVTAVSPSLPRRELDAARALATERGWAHLVVGTHEVERDEYARNDSDRCYWCKATLFDVLEPLAA